MIFECELVESRNKDGSLEACGVRWTEARVGLEWCLDKVLYGAFHLGFWVALLGGGWALMGFVPPFVPIMGLFIIGAAYWAKDLRELLPSKERELTFWRNGSMLAPFGLSTVHNDPLELLQEHAEINSIEVEQVVQPKGENPLPFTHGVWIAFKDGDVSHIAQNLTPDDRTGSRSSSPSRAPL